MKDRIAKNKAKMAEHNKKKELELAFWKKVDALPPEESKKIEYKIAYIDGYIVRSMDNGDQWATIELGFGSVGIHDYLHEIYTIWGWKVEIIDIPKEGTSPLKGLTFKW